MVRAGTILREARQCRQEWTVVEVEPVQPRASPHRAGRPGRPAAGRPAAALEARRRALDRQDFERIVHRIHPLALQLMPTLLPLITTSLDGLDFDLPADPRS